MRQRLSLCLSLLLVLVVGCAREETPADADRHGAASPTEPTMSLGTATGWVEMKGERTELSRAGAFRVEVCPGEFAVFVVLTDRPMDPERYVVPLTPPLDIRTGLDNLLHGNEAGTFALISERVQKPYLEVARYRPGGFDAFNGPAVLTDIRPEIRLETEAVIEGGWKGKTDGRNWLGGPASWEFEFAAAISDHWLAGEPLPTDGGPPGEVVRSYIDASPAGDFPEGGELLGGRENGERAMVGWRSPDGGTGFFFLESEPSLEEGGAPEWRIVAKVPCIRLG